MQHKECRWDPKRVPQARDEIVQPNRALIGDWKAEATVAGRTLFLTLVLISCHTGAAAGSE